MRSIFFILAAVLCFSVFGAEGKAPSSIMENILLKVDFDSPVQAGSETFKNDLPEAGYCEGRHGRGYFFQPSSRNLLPPGLADIRELSPALAGIDNAKLNVMKEKSPVGETVLSVQGKGVRLNGLSSERWEKVYYQKVALIASFFIKGPKGDDIAAELRLQPFSGNAKVLFKRFQDKNFPEKYKEELYPDVSFPAKVKLTGGWQRVAVTAEFDARTCTSVPRTADLLITSGGANRSIALNGFQLEQTRVVYSNFYPVSWMPGKTSLPMGSSCLTLKNPRSFFEHFPRENGAVSFWIRPVADCNSPYVQMGNLFAFTGERSQPVWGFLGNQISIGDKKSYHSGKAIPENVWSHIVISWDEKKLDYFVNGKKVKSYVRDKFTDAPDMTKYVFSLGGFQNQKISGRQMDEFIVLGRALSESDVAFLYNHRGPLTVPKDKLTVAPLLRTVFFRNDPAAELVLNIFSPRGQKISLTWRISDYPSSSAAFDVKEGNNEVKVSLEPYLYPAGAADFHFSVSDDKGVVLFDRTDKINIMKQLRLDTVKFLGWCRPGKIPLSYFRQLGLNQLTATTSEEMKGIADTDMLGNWFLNNTREFQADNFEPSRIRETLVQKIEEMKGFFNWTSVLINSEMCGENRMPELKEYPRLMKQAEKALGFTPPMDRIQFAPARCSFGPEPRNEQGVYTPGETFKSLWWFSNDGMQWIQLNSIDINIFRKLAPGRTLWTDPVGRAGPLMFRDFDMVSSWSYSPDPAMFLGNLNEAYSVAAALKKPFMPTLGMPLFCGRPLKCRKDGRELSVTTTVDELREKTWLAIGGIPCRDICFWAAEAWYEDGGEGGQYLVEKEASLRFGELVRSELYPAAMLLRDMPREPARVGLLLPESTRWYSDAPGWSYSKLASLWRTSLTLAMIPYDTLGEIDATRENLEKYDVIIFPMAKAVSKQIHDVLTAISGRTMIVTDNDCAAVFPNMKKLNFRYTSKMQYSQASFKVCSDFAEALYAKLKPSMGVRAEGEKGPVFVFERNFAGCKYIVVVNDLRKTGEFNRYLDGKDTYEGRLTDYRPYGVPQKVVVSLASDRIPVVYDFLRSRKVESERRNGRVLLETELPPGGARVFCVYPDEFSAVTISADGPFKAGNVGALTVKLTDRMGKAPGGRQVLNVVVTDKDGRTAEESGLYAMENGVLRIPLRFALRAPSGQWTVQVTELSSGLKKSLTFMLDSAEKGK